MYPQHRIPDPAVAALPLTANEPATRAATDWADRRGGIPQTLLKHADTPLVWDGGVLCAPTLGGGFLTAKLVAAEARLTISLFRYQDDEADTSVLTVPRAVFASETI